MQPKRKKRRSCIYGRGSGRPNQGILRERLKGQPPEHLEGAVVVGVGPTVVDEHGGEEGHDVEDDEDGDNPGIFSDAVPRAGPEEGDPLILESRSSRSCSLDELGGEWPCCRWS